MSLNNLTAQNAVNITKSDATIYDPPLKKLVILPDGTGGTVTIVNDVGDTVAIKADASLTAPIVVDGRVRQVKSTGTDLDMSYVLGVK